MITNHQSGTSINEITNGIYRISTPVPPEVVPGGFTFKSVSGWTFTVPKLLRPYFLHRRKLLGKLCHAA